LSDVDERGGGSLGRRERKKLAVERRIREAALELFREKGYDAATVEEIAERADVAKGTFFNYFPRKDTLLGALGEDLVGEALEELGPVEGWTGSGRDQLLKLFLRMAAIVARDPELSKVMLIESMRTVWVRSEADPIEQQFDALILGTLGRAVLRGEIDEAADVGRGAKLLKAAYVTTMVEWLKVGVPGDVYRAELTAKFDIVFRGLGMPGLPVKG
jgi:TetR/AcrR family transcriptional regulator, cholesterol catabolism regulator